MQMQSKLTERKQLRDWLNFELNKYGHICWYDIFELTEGAILRKHQMLLRKTEYYTNTKKKIRGLFYKVRLYRIQNKYTLHIPINTFGKGLHIMHLEPILVNGNASIGSNCSIHTNTSIVAGGNSFQAPTIGNNVVISVGAVILGNVHIADDIAIGANAVVNKSFDEVDITIAGVPARKISNVGRSSWNFN